MKHTHTQTQCTHKNTCNSSFSSQILSIVRAWYGGPHKHHGFVNGIDKLSLWQEGNEKGKIVTEILRDSIRLDGALDFNATKQGCNAIFDFGNDWSCWKVLVVEYRYGEGPVKTWFSPSEAGEPYDCFLPANLYLHEQACVSTNSVGLKTNRMQICIQIPWDKKNVYLHLNEKTTIYTVKSIIQDKRGIPTFAQFLTNNARVLEDGRTLADYNIEEDSQLHLGGILGWKVAWINFWGNRLRMVRMRITFERLLEQGITPQIMSVFAMPLSVWRELGFGPQHALEMDKEDCKLVFDLEKEDLVKTLTQRKARSRRRFRSVHKV